jgi:hypothetical protein
MSRELKFKAVSLDTNKWVVGYGICLYRKDNIANLFHKQGLNIMQATGVYPESICEYSGIGNIFEKDELKSPENQLRGYVEFNAGAFSLKITMSNNKSFDKGQSIALFDFNEMALELTGRNIYDNPEILGE